MKKVLVTGGSSFISQHIIKMLMDSTDHIVTTTIRSNSNRTAILNAWCATYPKRLNIEMNTLDSPVSLKEILTGKEVVIHVASPFLMTNNKEEVVNPALQMTRSILEACFVVKTIQKVIFTSSSVTMSQIISKDPITEDMYTTASNLTPYEASKVESEKYIWKFVQENNPHFKVVSIHPSAVMGPSFSSDVVSASVKSFVIDVLNGNSLPFQTQLDILMVDVRDVARAHILAINSGEGRYLCCSQSVPISDIITMANEMYTLPNAPTIHVPSLLVHGLALFLDANTSSFLKGHVGKGQYKFNNSKIICDLGMTFMNMKDSLRETIVWCDENKLLKH